jgi:hypothetical protein
VGVIAGVLNRRNIGPQEGKRSRGELVLDALDFADAADAVAMLRELTRTPSGPSTGSPTTATPCAQPR